MPGVESSERLGEVYQEPSAAERKRSGWIYKQETDAWEKAPWHPDEIDKRIRAGMLKTDRAIDAIVDKLPVSQWGKIEALQDKLLSAGSPNAEDLMRVLRLRQTVMSKVEGECDPGECAGIGEGHLDQADPAVEEQSEHEYTAVELLAGCAEAVG